VRQRVTDSVDGTSEPCESPTCRLDIVIAQVNARRGHQTSRKERIYDRVDVDGGSIRKTIVDRHAHNMDPKRAARTVDRLRGSAGRFKGPTLGHEQYAVLLVGDAKLAEQLECVSVSPLVSSFAFDDDPTDLLAGHCRGDAIELGDIPFSCGGPD
jgi:hypothetical protein